MLAPFTQTLRAMKADWITFCFGNPLQSTVDHAAAHQVDE